MTYIANRPQNAARTLAHGVGYVGYLVWLANNANTSTQLCG